MKRQAVGLPMSEKNNTQNFETIMQQLRNMVDVLKILDAPQALCSKVAGVLQELEAWVNAPLPDDAHFLDNDDEKPRLRLSDDQVWQQIIKIAGVTCSSDFQKSDKTKQRELTEQREQRHACMTFVESRRKSIESSIRPVARVGSFPSASWSG